MPSNMARNHFNNRETTGRLERLCIIAKAVFQAGCNVWQAATLLSTWNTRAACCNLWQPCWSWHRQTPFSPFPSVSPWRPLMERKNENSWNKMNAREKWQQVNTTKTRETQKYDHICWITTSWPLWDLIEHGCTLLIQLPPGFWLGTRTNREAWLLSNSILCTVVKLWRLTSTLHSQQKR